MAKLAVIFVVALVVALQGCSCSIIQHHTDLEEAVGIYAKASKEIEHVRQYIGKHIAPIARDFEHKIDEVMEEEAIYPVIESLRENITNLEANIGDESKQCIDNAWRMVAIATQNTKTGVDNCVSGARTVVGDMTAVTEEVNGKAILLVDYLTNGYHTCMNDESTTNDEKAVCLHAVIDPLLESINNLDAEVKHIYHDLNIAFHDGKRNLQICLQKVREDLQAMSNTIISETQGCIEGSAATGRTHQEQRQGFEMPRGILDFFRELKEKIEYIIHLATHLPGSIAEIPDKINEIIAHINISAVISQLKSEVEDIIDQGGRDAEQCRKPAETILDDLASKSEAEAGECMQGTEALIDEIQDAIEARIDEAKQLLKDVNSQVFNCWWDNKFNPIAFTRCLETNYTIYKQKLLDLQKRVSETLDQAKVQAVDLIQDFAKCMNTIQLNIVKKGQAIIKETEDCVRNAHH